MEELSAGELVTVWTARASMSGELHALAGFSELRARKMPSNVPFVQMTNVVDNGVSYGGTLLDAANNQPVTGDSKWRHYQSWVPTTGRTPTGGSTVLSLGAAANDPPLTVGSGHIQCERAGAVQLSADMLFSTTELSADLYRQAVGVRFRLLRAGQLSWLGPTGASSYTRSAGPTDASGDHVTSSSHLSTLHECEAGDQIRVYTSSMGYDTGSNMKTFAGLSEFRAVYLGA